jgi:hypothetical protein
MTLVLSSNVLSLICQFLAALNQRRPQNAWKLRLQSRLSAKMRSARYARSSFAWLSGNWPWAGSSVLNGSHDPLGGRETNRIRAGGTRGDRGSSRGATRSFLSETVDLGHGVRQDCGLYGAWSCHCRGR